MEDVAADAQGEADGGEREREGPARTAFEVEAQSEMVDGAARPTTGSFVGTSGRSQTALLQPETWWLADVDRE